MKQQCLPRSAPALIDARTEFSRGCFRRLFYNQTSPRDARTYSNYSTYRPCAVSKLGAIGLPPWSPGSVTLTSVPLEHFGSDCSNLRRETIAQMGPGASGRKIGGSVHTRVVLPSWTPLFRNTSQQDAHPRPELEVRDGVSKANWLEVYFEPKLDVSRRSINAFDPPDIGPSGARNWGAKIGVVECVEKLRSELDI
jgi:hypothetical protein